MAVYEGLDYDNLEEAWAAGLLKRGFVGGSGPFYVDPTDEYAPSEERQLDDEVPADPIRHRAFRGNQMYVDDDPEDDKEVPRRQDISAVFLGKSIDAPLTSSSPLSLKTGPTATICIVTQIIVVLKSISGSGDPPTIRAGVSATNDVLLDRQLIALTAANQVCVLPTNGIIRRLNAGESLTVRASTPATYSTYVTTLLAFGYMIGAASI